MTGFGPAALPDDLELRQLELEDVAAISGLIGACDRSYLEWAPDEWSPPEISSDLEKWRRRLAEDEHWTLGALDAQGDLVGMTAARQATVGEPEVPIACRGHLGALFVHPSRWRQRIGVGLLERAELAMRELGFEAAMLITPELGPARAFYEATGWSANGEREYQQDFDMGMVEYEKDLP